MIKCEVDKNSLKNIKNMLNPAHRKSSAINALNVTIRKVRKAAKEKVNKTYMVAKKDTAAAMEVFTANRNRTYAEFVVKSKRRGLIHFKPQKVPGGTSVKVKRSHNWFYRSAFIQTMNTAKNVWERKGKPRFPIRRKTAPSTSAMTEECAQDEMKKSSSGFSEIFAQKMRDKIEKNRIKALKRLNR